MADAPTEVMDRYEFVRCLEEAEQNETVHAFTSGKFTADGDMVFAAIGEATYAKRVADCSPNECEDDKTQAFAEGESEANAILFASSKPMYEAINRTLARLHDLPDFLVRNENAVLAGIVAEALTELRTARGRF